MVLLALKLRNHPALPLIIPLDLIALALIEPSKFTEPDTETLEVILTMSVVALPKNVSPVLNNPDIEYVFDAFNAFAMLAV